MKFIGNNGQIEVLQDRLVITRKGLVGFLTQGFGGEKTIPFSSISAVQYREPGMVILGYIQFKIMGAPEGSNPATDENTVNFTRGKQEQDFRRLKQHMDSVLFQTGDQPKSDEKVCPRCAETIKLAAQVCRFCGHEFGA
jgi:ribosomal protein L40E